MKLQFNLTLEDYDTVLKFQKGTCAICGRPPVVNRLAVDHCHKTGLIRGLCCMRCNKGLALFGDNPHRLLDAANYLKFPPATSALGSARYGRIGKTGIKSATRKKLERALSRSSS